MGLHLSILRDDYDSRANLFHGKARVTLVDVDGPFDPTPDAPAAFLDRGPFGDVIVRPVDAPPDSAGPITFGGTFGYSSDSRVHDALRKMTGDRKTHHALAIHDRFDTWADFDALTR